MDTKPSHHVRPGTEVYLDGRPEALTLQAVLLERSQSNDWMCLCTYADKQGVLRNITVCLALLSLQPPSDDTFSGADDEPTEPEPLNDY